MTSHLQKLLGRGDARADSNPIDFNQWIEMFEFNGLNYGGGLLNQTFAGGKTQEILPNYSSLASQAMRQNGIVWACVVARMMLFGEAVFQYRPLGSITSGDLYGTQALSLIENPWPGADTRKLLNLVDLHAQLDGNGYVYRDPNVPALRVARPDWMTIVLGSRKPARPDFEAWDIDTEVLGYIYRPNGQSAEGSPAISFLIDEVAHFMPIPDPIFHFRGMSWLQPVVQEILGDTAMTEHKNAFLQNAATPNMVVTLDPSVRKEEFDAWVDKFDAGHHGALNAYKTIYLAGGADAKVVGADLKQLDFRMVQAHGETRICNAAGIPPIIVGVSEGLDSATYSNYAQARRAWADAQLRPLWSAVCSALGTVVDVPTGSELWYDARKIPFLQQDEQDQAEIQQTQANTMLQLINSGWKPESVQAFLQTGDLGRLSHTGLFSIQLQPPGLQAPPPAAAHTPPALAPAPAPGVPKPPAAVYSIKASAPQKSPESPETPIAASRQLAAPTPLACSLCQQPAASNVQRCTKCQEFAAALATAPIDTIAALAEQLGLTTEDVQVRLGLKKLPPPPLVVTGNVRDRLTPVLNGSGRL